MSETQPYDYAAEREDARRADQWRYPQPGQVIGGEWREWDRADAEADR